MQGMQGMQADRLSQEALVNAYANTIRELAGTKIDGYLSNVNEKLSHLLPNSDVRVECTYFRTWSLEVVVCCKGLLDIDDTVVLLKDIYRPEANWDFVQNYFYANNKGNEGDRPKINVSSFSFNGLNIPGMIGEEMEKKVLPVSCIGSLQHFYARLLYKMRQDMERLRGELLYVATNLELPDWDRFLYTDKGEIIK